MLGTLTRNRIVAGIVVILLIALAVILFIRRTPAHISTCVVGDVQARLQAYVPPNLRSAYLDAKMMRFGLGNGAISGWDSLGDAIAIGGKLWLRTTNERSPHFYALVSSRYFQTNAFAYVPINIPAKTQWSLNTGLSFSQIWQHLGTTYPRGVIAAGYIHLQELHSIAIAHPAIRAMPILSNAQLYYTEPMESAKDLWAYAVTIVARTSRFGWRDNNLLSRLIAKETNEDIQGRTYILRLASPPTDIALPPAEATIENLGQVIGNSTVASGLLQIYPILTPAVCEPSVPQDL